MGEKKVYSADDPQVRKTFVEHLIKDVKAMQKMLDMGLFESGVQRLGAELELCIVDKSWQPAPIITDLMDDIEGTNFTTELARFNLEINLDPLTFEGDCLSVMRKELNSNLIEIEKLLKKHKTKAVMIGILPTISDSDLTPDSLTPLQRYEALAATIDKLSGGSFNFNIKGTDELITKHDSVVLEACNTSFQLHFQVDPDKFVPMYNWAQAITGPVLASATNSPMLLGKRLWRETRIALFQQSLDFRKSEDVHREESPRVSFGNDWVHNSAVEIYKEDIARYRVMLSTDVEEDALKALEEGKIPKLSALNVHNGTVYKWNRACYGITEGKPHLRIENRVLPSGPTVKDQVANAAFWLGLMNNMPKECENIQDCMDFDDAKTNFLKAAQQGLSAQFVWFDKKEITSQDLILKTLLPMAAEGLAKAKIKKSDINTYLNIIKERVKTGRTGSQWILDSFTKLKKDGGTKGEALIATTAGLHSRQRKGTPVHTWTLPELHETRSMLHADSQIHQIMATDLFTVHRDDPIHFVAHIMDWRNIRHLPVEDENGKLVGLVTSGTIIKHLGDTERIEENQNLVETIMVKEMVTAKPDTQITEALKLMIDHKIGCVPVTKDDRLVGLLTEHDFVKMTAKLLDEKEGK